MPILWTNCTVRSRTSKNLDGKTRNELCQETMILSFKEYLQEASNCPDGKKYCPKCQMCVEKTCEEKKMMKEEAWQRKEGKNKSGGLNEKGRKSYERANPGSDLKAPSKKKGNKRRASFCARMKGMKRKLTSAKTARDPDSRINKSLRAWNC